jgi:molecular chaperone IbpA
VQGVQDRNEDEQEYYFKGIAARNFTRHFTLAEGVEVKEAEFVDGMLNVLLNRNLPEEKKPITIKVNKSIPSKKELLQES